MSRKEIARWAISHQPRIQKTWEYVAEPQNGLKQIWGLLSDPATTVNKHFANRSNS